MKRSRPTEGKDDQKEDELPQPKSKRLKLQQGRSPTTHTVKKQTTQAKTTRQKRDETSDDESGSSESDSDSVSSNDDENDENDEKKSGGIVNGHTPLLIYLLESVNHPTRVYIGYTYENPITRHGMPRRLAQHNGVISGGPPRTKRYRPWRVVATLRAQDPSWFHKRHALYVEKCLQTLARDGLKREIKWRKNPKSISKRYQKLYRDLAPPPELATLSYRGHTVACYRIQSIVWFLHTFGQWPIRSQYAQMARQRGHRRKRAKTPLDIRKGTDPHHSMCLSIHADFWRLDWAQQVQLRMRYWSLVIRPLESLEPYVRKRK